MTSRDGLREIAFIRSNTFTKRELLELLAALPDDRMEIVVSLNDEIFSICGLASIDSGPSIEYGDDGVFAALILYPYGC